MDAKSVMKMDVLKKVVWVANKKIVWVTLKKVILIVEVIINQIMKFISIV